MEGRDLDQQWNAFYSRFVTQIPEDVVNNIRNITRRHLDAGNNEQKARHIKVAFVDSLSPPPRVILWEVHLPVKGLDPDDDQVKSPTIHDLIRDLRDSLRNDAPQLTGLNFDLYFATAHLGHVIGNSEYLRNYLAAYGDKIYAVPVEQSNKPLAWTEYRDFFVEAGKAVRANPLLYLELCNHIANFFVRPGKEDSFELYQHIVLLRCLPECVAYGADLTNFTSNLATDPHTINPLVESTRTLINLLQQFENRGETLLNESTIYNVINALEWLAYVEPRIFSEDLVDTDSSQVRPLYIEYAEILANCINDQNGYHLTSRVEAAWAIGWAGVASIAVATFLHKSFTPDRIRQLNSAVLRFVTASAYMRASFTLASFGPARVTAGAAEKIPPGSTIFSRSTNQIKLIYSDSLKAAAEVVTSEVARISGTRNRISGSRIITSVIVAGVWLIFNGIAAYLINTNRSTIDFLFVILAPPAIFLWVIAAIVLTQQGKRHWNKIVQTSGIIAAGAGLIATIIGIWQFIDPVIQTVIKH
jgi:hypothetical protein